MFARNVLGATIPLRFLTTVGHLLALIIATYSKDGNILTATPIIDTNKYYYNQFNQSLIAGFALSFLFLSIEFFGLFSGITMFNSASNIYYVFNHSIATILLSIFIVDEWHYLTYWYMFPIFNLLPVLVEVFNIVRLKVLKVR